MKIIRQLVACLSIALVCLAAGTTTASADNRDEIVFFFNDALGSAVAAVNEAGELCWDEVYTPYGDKTINDDVVNVTGCGIVGEERGFTGHTEDVNSDLVYMQQRYYDPSIGRFLSIDPLNANPNDPKTYNRYAYANNNPYKYVDPDGELPVLAIPLLYSAGVFVAKEVAAEFASQATGGMTDFLSVRKTAKKGFISARKLLNPSQSSNVPKKVPGPDGGFTADLSKSKAKSLLLRPEYRYFQPARGSNASALKASHSTS